MHFDIDITARQPVTTAGAGPSIDIAKRLKQFRQERGWTLGDASKAIGLAHSTLSKIERNELSPTLATIQKIARGFDLDVVELLASTETSKGKGRRSITRKGDPAWSTTETCRNAWLANDLLQKKMLPFRTTVQSHDVSEYSEWQYHNAEIFVFVLSGRLIVHSEFYEPVVLNAGESIYYDASMGHKWTSDGDEDADVLWVYAQQ